MAKNKYQNVTAEVISFDYEGKEKIMLPGESYTLESNSYIDGLEAQGRLLLKSKSTESETPKPE